jgi:hypothetical protein
MAHSSLNSAKIIMQAYARTKRNSAVFFLSLFPIR